MGEANITNNKRIAKNTMFLYMRMLFSMIVSLYTSRVILDVLGVEDYGIYGVVGSVVGMLSFLNGTLSIGTSRFLTFSLGEEKIENLKKTFSTALSIHLILAVIIILLAETIGLWFVYNKLIISPERLSAAVIVYHLSIISAFIVITQVPYTACIIAHERMKIYAYFGMVEVLLKLSIVFLLKIGNYDKLVFYAILLLVVQIIIALFYRFYCIKNFKESKYRFSLDKRIAKSMLGFSGWNLVANLSITLNLQGVVVITNLFFGPVVVAAQTIVNQVNVAIMQFVNNFRTAINPQIIKTYASQQYEESKKLTLDSTCYVFYLMLLLGLPVILLADPLLNMWLTTVPPYTTVFLQLIIIQNLIDTFGASYYIPLMASGKVKGNSIASVFLGVGRFIIVYILFKIGFPPTTVLWAGIIACSIYSFIVKPYLLTTNLNYKWKDFVPSYISCLKVLIFSLPLPIILYMTYPKEHFLYFFIIGFVSVLSIVCSVWMWGLSKNTRSKISEFILLKIKRHGFRKF